MSGFRPRIRPLEREWEVHEGEEGKTEKIGRQRGEKDQEKGKTERRRKQRGDRDSEEVEKGK